MRTLQMTFMCRHTFEVTDHHVNLCIQTSDAYISDALCPYCEDPSRGPVENDKRVRIKSMITAYTEHDFFTPDEPFSSSDGLQN